MSALAAELRFEPASQRPALGWVAGFLLALAAHVTIALWLHDRELASPDGGMSVPDMMVEMSELPLFEVLGDQSGASDAMSPGEVVEEPGEAETAQTIETTRAETVTPTVAEMLAPTETDVAEPLTSPTEALTAPAATALDSSVTPEAAEPPPTDQTIEPGIPRSLEMAAAPEAEPVPATPPAETADAASAKPVDAPPPALPLETPASSPSHEPLQSSPAEVPAMEEPLEASLPRPLAMAEAESEPAPATQSSEPAIAAPAPTTAAPAKPSVEALAPVSSVEPLAPDPLAPVLARPLAALAEAQTLVGEVSETLNLAALPRPRPDAVSEAFMREHERRQREAETRRVAAERQVAERTAERADRVERRARAKPQPAKETGTATPRRAESRAGGSGATGATRRDPGAGRAATSSYQDRVYARLQRNKRFPSGERRGGVVTVGFRVAASGAASGIRLVRGSGNPALDRAALDLVRRASPFPPIPPEVGRNSLGFVVPIDYSMR